MRFVKWFLSFFRRRKAPSVFIIDDDGWRQWRPEDGSVQVLADDGTLTPVDRSEIHIVEE